MRIVWLVIAVAVLSACSSSPVRSTPRAGASSQRTAPAGMDFKPAQVREAAVVLRFEFGTGTFENDERSALPAQYEGTLLEALNAKALLTRDLRVLGKGERFDPRSGIARARELGADHVIFVGVKIDRGEMSFCSRSRQPLRVATTRWTQTAEVIRVSDGATRLTVPAPGIQSGEFEADCESPRSSRQRSRDDTLTEGVEALLKRVAGP